MGFPIDNLEPIIELIDEPINARQTAKPPFSVARESADRAVQREFAFDVAETPRPILRIMPRGPERSNAEADVDISRSSRRSSSEKPTLTGSQRIGRWIAVAGGCGYVPVAPGTAGSAAGAVLFLGLFELMPGSGAPMAFFLSLAGLIVILTLLGSWASGVAEREFGQKDDGRIVIDEVVGQLIALMPLPFLLSVESVGAEAGFFSIIVGVVTGFVLFRLFDVWKPGAIGWAERNFKGGFGVMADDLVAGAYAAAMLVSLAIAAELVSPGIFFRMASFSIAQDGPLS